MKTARILVASLLFIGAGYAVAQSAIETREAEAAAEQFFADPSFTQDYRSAEAAAAWQEVEERDASDPLQAMLARGANRSR